MAKWSSQNCKLEIEKVPASGTFTPIPQILSVPFPGTKADFEDVTDLDSTAREYVPKIQDVGELQCEMIWDPTNTEHDFLLDASLVGASSKVLYNWKAKASDSGTGTFAFSAYVMGFQPTAAVDSALKATLTLRQSGAVIYTQ